MGPETKIYGGQASSQSVGAHGCAPFVEDRQDETVSELTAGQVEIAADDQLPPGSFFSVHYTDPGE